MLNEQREISTKMVAGFWIRVIADFFDFAIISIFGLLLSVFAENWLMTLGGKGAWIGLLICSVYFVPMQSRFGDGQSFGKRLMNIQILDLQGQPLSLWSSFLRYLVVSFVAYFSVLSGIIDLKPDSTLNSIVPPILLTIWLLAFFGCYILMPLHPLKRGLHDLIANSIVVYRNQFNATVVSRLNDPGKIRRAYAIVGVLSAVVFMAGAWNFSALTASMIPRNETPAQTQDLYRQLEATGKLQSPYVFVDTSTKGLSITRTLILNAVYVGPAKQTREDLKPLFDLAFKAIRSHFKELSQYDKLRVVLSFGYDIGIYRKNSDFYQEEYANTSSEEKETGSEAIDPH
jgi:uncharacterized RDD family membrane protein YckC